MCWGGGSEGTVSAKKETPRVPSQCLSNESSLGCAKLLSRGSILRGASWESRGSFPQEGSTPGMRAKPVGWAQSSFLMVWQNLLPSSFLEDRKIVQVILLLSSSNSHLFFLFLIFSSHTSCLSCWSMEKSYQRSYNDLEVKSDTVILLLFHLNYIEWN